jgi:hypothetical protein
MGWEVGAEALKFLAFSTQKLKHFYLENEGTILPILHYSLHKNLWKNQGSNTLMW